MQGPLNGDLTRNSSFSCHQQVIEQHFRSSEYLNFSKKCITLIPIIRLKPFENITSQLNSILDLTGLHQPGHVLNINKNHQLITKLEIRFSNTKDNKCLPVSITYIERILLPYYTVNTSLSPSWPVLSLFFAFFNDTKM